MPQNRGNITPAPQDRLSYLNPATQTPAAAPFPQAAPGTTVGFLYATAGAPGGLAPIIPVPIAGQTLPTVQIGAMT